MLTAVKYPACPAEVPKPDEAIAMLYFGRYDVRIF